MSLAITTVARDALCSSSNPFFAEVVRGVEETAKQNGYRILLLNTDESPDREADYTKMFVSMKVAGILVTKSTWWNPSTR